MLRLEHAIRNQAGNAPVVPGMWPSLAERQVAVRRGEVSMIGGAPGAGKSTIALALAVRAAPTRTLYISADTHAHTVSLRLLAMLSGQEQSQIEPMMESHPEWVHETLKQASHIRWCFDSAPTVQSIEEEIEAYEELFDSPDLIVVDNLMDIVHGDGDPWQGMKNLLLDMKQLSRNHDTAMLVLHHTSEAYQVGRGNGSPTPPLSALQGKVGPTPALVLTVSNHDDGVMYVSPVKNRYGSSWPSGDSPTWLGYNPAAMQVFDPSERG